ncbi:hypothetical protein MMC30_000766 [Trapelia coarctata]|nr:hypothetical protein [Trapelia coarctata]
MGNVRRGIGRSKGCITCKKRKIKCDEAKPWCSRCRSSYLVCEGYETGLIFVNHTVGCSKPQSWAKTDCLSLERKETTLLDRQALSHNGWSSPPPANFSLRAFQANICVSYMIPKLFVINSSCSSSQPRKSWVFDAIEQDKTSLVSDAVSCLAEAYIAQKQGGEVSFLEEAAVYYGKAVHRLSRNLHDPLLRRDLANIVAALLLGLYEMGIFKNRSGWIQHAGGVGKLFEMRGAESHREGAARSYFLGCRLLITTRALALRKRTFLEDQDWITIPWMDNPTPKSSMHRLIDVVARIPGLLEDSDRIQAEQATADTPNLQEIEPYRRRVVTVLCDLLNWRWGWELSHSQKAAADSSTLSQSSKDSDGVSYEVEGCHHDFVEDRASMLYNIALRQVLDLRKTWSVADTSFFELGSLPYQGQHLPLSPLALPHGIVPLAEIACAMCRLMDCQEGYQL